MLTVSSSDIRGSRYEVPVDQLSWRPAAYGIVIKDGAILLTKQHGAYHLPGGGVDLGEFPEVGVLREIHEETGIEAANPRIVDCTSTFFSYEYPEGAPMTHVQSVLLYFRCDYAGGELSTEFFTEDERAVGEIAEWVPLESLDTINAGSTVDWRKVVKRAVSGTLNA